MVELDRSSVGLSAAAAHSGIAAAAELRLALARVAEFAEKYLTSSARRIFPRIEPGEITAQLPASPGASVSLSDLLDEFENVVLPGITHWNDPSFFAYFANTGSPPGIVAEALIATLNVNAMLWRSSPVATELELLACDWLRQLLGLPDVFTGHITDTASTSTLVALAAARDRAVPTARTHGLQAAPGPLKIFASEHAHSSVDKAALVLGLGAGGVRKIPTDTECRMLVDELVAAISQERKNGAVPVAVVATAGTTSTTSLDPIAEIAEVCARHRVWLHVDAAYGGSAAVCAEKRALFEGWQKADSIVVNPHKWLFVPMDCSVLLTRGFAALEEAFSLVPEYLRSEQPTTDLMNLGFQLGRRFRGLKLWFVLRWYGREGLQQIIRLHCELAQRAARGLETAGFCVVMPVPLSTVCFRWADLENGSIEASEEANRFHYELMKRSNGTGEIFLSHTALDGKITLRLAIGNARTGEEHVDAAVALLARQAKQLRDEWSREKGLP